MTLGGTPVTFSIIFWALVSNILLWSDKNWNYDHYLPFWCRKLLSGFSIDSLSQFFIILVLFARLRRVERIIGKNFTILSMTIPMIVTIILGLFLPIRQISLFLILTNLHLIEHFVSQPEIIFATSFFTISNRLITFSLLSILFTYIPYDQRHILPPLLGTLISPSITILLLLSGARLTEALSPSRNSKPIMVNIGIATLKTEDGKVAADEESSLSSLMNLGFTREQCISALRKSKGNLERASNILIDGSFP